MKIFVLIHSESGQIDSSEAFKNEQDAINKMKEDYEDFLESDYIESELYDNYAKVVYDDLSYDRLDIVEVEVEV